MIEETQQLDDVPEDWTPEEELQYQGFNKALHLIDDAVRKDMKRLTEKEDAKYCLAYLRIIHLIANLGQIPKTCTPEEIEKMQRLRKLGLSIRQIAFIHQRSLDTIQRHVEHITSGDQ